MLDHTINLEDNSSSVESLFPVQTFVHSERVSEMWRGVTTFTNTLEAGIAREQDFIEQILDRSKELDMGHFASTQTSADTGVQYSGGEAVHTINADFGNDDIQVGNDAAAV